MGPASVDSGYWKSQDVFGSAWATHDAKYGTREFHKSKQDAELEARRDPAMIKVVEYRASKGK